MNQPTNDRSGMPDSEDVYDEAVRWFMVLRRSESNRSDQRAFEQWLNASPEHVRAFDRCKADWDGLEPLASIYGAKTRKHDAPFVSGVKIRSNWLWVAGIAAMLATVVTIGMIAVNWVSPTYEVSAHTQIAEHKTVELMDGSRIELNGHSRVRIEYYRGQRVSHLDEGEALFDVVSDPNRPFTVEAGIGTVRVVGTSFQVTREHDRLAVAVRRGQVQVQVEHATSPAMNVALSAGQAVNVTHAGIEPIRVVAAETVGAWKRNVLIFDRSPLRDVVRDLQRHYRGTIRLDAAASDIPLTAVVQFSDIDTTLAALPTTLPVRVDHPSPTEWYIHPTVKS